MHNAIRLLIILLFFGLYFVFLFLIRHLETIDKVVLSLIFLIILAAVVLWFGSQLRSGGGGKGGKYHVKGSWTKSNVPGKYV